MTSQPETRFWNVAFKVYEALPRQGPGSRACTARALKLCGPLPPKPAILDLGCGAGGQTLLLADMTDGIITAIDRHAPFIDQLRERIAARGFSHRIHPIVGDMLQPGLKPGTLDLIWSEGALYNIGLPAALGICHDLLRSGGLLAFTNAVWTTARPPENVKAMFDAEYPTMGSADADIAAIERAGFEMVDHFTLPDDAWWDDFYTPMLARIAELREHCGHDEATGRILDEIAQEPEMHRSFGNFYAYEFFIARKLPKRRSP